MQQISNSNPIKFWIQIQIQIQWFTKAQIQSKSNADPFQIRQIQIQDTKKVQNIQIQITNPQNLQKLLKGVVSKNLQKPYICGRGGYNSWSEDAYHVDTLRGNR